MVDLKKLRESAGLSLEQLSVGSSIPLHDIERYERTPGTIEKAYVEVAVVLALALGVTMEEFIKSE